jgi:phosphoserine phosphatase
MSDLSAHRQTLLVRVSGRDQPGITAGILHVLADVEADIVDIEQVVLHDRLNLGLLIRIDPDDSPLKDLLLLGWERDIDVDFEIVNVGDAPSAPPRRFAVTVLGSRLTPSALGAVTDAIVTGGGNIERITRLSTYPVTSFELIVVGGDLDRLRNELLVASSDHGVDIAVQPEGLLRRAKRLVVIDMDSTLIQDEVIDLLAAEAGAGPRVATITTEAMAGETDFADALRSRVELLAGLTEAQLDAVWERVRLTPGAATFVRTLKRLGYTTAIVSGGFTYFADRLADRLGIDHAYANALEIVDGVVTGRVLGDLLDGPGKARCLIETAEAQGVSREQTVAIGDGANDLEMLSVAGLGIAFNAKPVVEAAADTKLRVPYLDAILFMLGIRREEVEAADREDG